MMRLLFIFSMALMLASCGSADKPAATGPASIEWIDSVKQDVGTIDQGAKIEITWKFRNTGNNPLIISNVRAGCGCTGAEGPKQPIAPGNEGVITARFDSEHYPNMQTKSVYVTANAKTKNGTPEEELQFSVMVKPTKKNQ